MPRDSDPEGAAHDSPATRSASLTINTGAILQRRFSRCRLLRSGFFFSNEGSNVQLPR